MNCCWPILIYVEMEEGVVENFKWGFIVWNNCLKTFMLSFFFFFVDFIYANKVFFFVQICFVELLLLFKLCVNSTQMWTWKNGDDWLLTYFPTKSTFFQILLQIRIKPNKSWKINLSFSYIMEYFNFHKSKPKIFPLYYISHDKSNLTLSKADTCKWNDSIKMKGINFTSNSSVLRTHTFLIHLFDHRHKLICGSP